jgi:hypothetical protein
MAKAATVAPLTGPFTAVPGITPSALEVAPPMSPLPPPQPKSSNDEPMASIETSIGHILFIFFISNSFTINRAHIPY